MKEDTTQGISAWRVCCCSGLFCALEGHWASLSTARASDLTWLAVLSDLKSPEFLSLKPRGVWGNQAIGALKAPVGQRLLRGEGAEHTLQWDSDGLNLESRWSLIVTWEGKGLIQVTPGTG